MENSIVIEIEADIGVGAVAVVVIDTKEIDAEQHFAAG